MSLNRFGNKTLTGEDDLEVDKINITGEGIGFNDNFGTSGQIIKKSTIDNTIGWFQEQTFTATLPITINGGVIGFNTQQGANKIATSIEDLGSGVLSRKLTIGDNGTNNFIKLQELNGLVACNLLNTDNLRIFESGDINIYEGTNTLKLTLSKNSILPASGNTTFNIGSSVLKINEIHSTDLFSTNIGSSTNKVTKILSTNIGDSSNPINEIISNTQNTKLIIYVGDLSGNFITLSPTGISGNVNSHITGFKSFTLQQGDGSDATKLISSNGNTITTHGGLLKTFGGNLDMERVIGSNTTRGEIRNFSLIRGNTYALPSQNSIDYVGQATIRRIYMNDLVFYDFNDNGATGSANIIINGTNNSINGDTNTTMSGIASLNIGSITATGNITLSGTGSLGILTCNNSAILTNGFKQAIGGGNFSVTSNGTFVMNDGIFNGNVDFNDNEVSNISLLDMGGGTIQNVIMKGFTLSGNISGNDYDMIIKAIQLSGVAGSGLDMNNMSMINTNEIGFHSSGTGINMNNKPIIEVGGISMKSGGSGIDFNNTDITEVNSLTCTTLNLSGEISNSNIPSTITGNKTFSGNITTNDITLSSNGSNDRKIEFTGDTNYTCKYYTDFSIEVQYMITASSGSTERFHFNTCWFLGNRAEGYVESEIIDSIEPFGSSNSAISTFSTGTGTSGFGTYPHFLFKGTQIVNPGDNVVRRYFMSKIFPPNAFKDIKKIKYKAIAGNGMNGGNAIGSKSRLYLLWDKGSGIYAHRGYNFPSFTGSDTTDPYFIQVGNQYMSGNWIDYTIDIFGVNTPSSTNIVLTSTQKTNILNARTIVFYQVYGGLQENIGITNIEIQSQNQLNTFNKINNLGEINDIRLTGNGYDNGSIYGFSYLGLNYCNGWYYEFLDNSKWIGDDDDETPSSLMIREPPVSFVGSNNTYGGLIMKGNHTQVYYCFNCPAGYRVVGYFVGLKNSNGTINTSTISSSFYNHLVRYSSCGTSNETGNTTSKAFIISEATDTNGTPNPILVNENANRSLRAYNREIPVRRTGGVGTGCIVPYTNNFPTLNNSKQFGSYNQLRDNYTYKIMAFKSYPGWTNAYAFSGGYIKYERWNGEDN